MELELWWLVLCLLFYPVFFGLGWLAARVDLRSVLKQAMTVPSNFYRALDALVEQKTDIAAQALSEVAQQQAGTVALQVTLGKLYRRRGEHDKAIRLHESVLESPDIVSDRRAQVLFELGQDFQNAGLVDRAEQIFGSLLQGNMSKLSHQVLLSIYQQDRDWQKAIEIASTLSHDEQTYQFEIAQFYCELAQVSLFKSDLIAARAYVDQALCTNKKCARANIILGDVEAKEGNLKAAIAAWQAIEKQNPECLSMVAERLYDAFDELGRAAEALTWLVGYSKIFPQLELVDILYQKSLLLEGEESAREITRELVHRHPTLFGVYRLIEAHMNGLPSEAKLDAEVMRSVVSKYAQKAMMYRCRRCNFKSQVFFWHCPACNQWESFTPNRTEI